MVAVKKARVGLYRAWVANIDEGWTRWILENYDFAPVTLRNGDIQAGNLRDRFDAIILPDAMPETIRNGFGPGIVPGEYTGGIGELGTRGAARIRAGGRHSDHVQQRFAVCDRRSWSAGEECLGGIEGRGVFLLRLACCASNCKTWRIPRCGDCRTIPIVMFERGPAFEAKEGFRGRVLAAYPKEQSPLMSGYLLHPEHIQGKAAALEVQYGKGRVYLFGFRPQWRGAIAWNVQIFLQRDLRVAGPVEACACSGCSSHGPSRRASHSASACRLRSQNSGTRRARRRHLRY